jgi:hypothetical protein
MSITDIPVTDIPGLTRIETTPAEQMMPVVAKLTQEHYSHEQVYGRFCNVQSYIAAPPDEVFDYMANLESLADWTYSLRDFRPAAKPGQLVARDMIGQDTNIYCEVVANRAALTVDYHCAWDQGEKLWMIYLNRIVDAELVLEKPGSVVFWQNCRHPFYDNNPFPDTAPATRPVWVGDIWGLFYAGHEIELRNLKTILEHRHAGA